MFDFETQLSGIEYKIRKRIDENNRLQSRLMELTEKNEN